MKKKYSEKYPRLNLCLGFYFNPDWDLDYSNPESAIRAFVIKNPLENIKKVCQELNQLLKENLPVEGLDEILFKDFGVYYDYRVDKISSTDWLKWVRAQIIYYAKHDKNLDLEKESE